MVPPPPLCLSRPNQAAVKRQLDEIRVKIGNDNVTCHLLGMKRYQLTHKLSQGVARAVQYLHAILFHQGETVVLVDVLTSFRYAPAPKPGKSSTSDMTGDGDGI